MTLTVEDGTGLAAADSYQSLAEIEAYFDLYGLRPSNWCTLGTDGREQKARAAFQWLNTLKYKGAKKTDAQAGLWPRVGVYDEEGYSVAEDSLPAELKAANAEVVIVACAGDLFTTITEGEVASESFRLGPISETISYRTPAPRVTQYPKIRTILRPLLAVGGSSLTVKGYRA